MLTTIPIDGNLLLLATERAAEQGTTLDALIADALHCYLGMPDPAAGPPLPVFEGGGGFVPGIDPTSNASVLDAADDDLSDFL